MLISQFQDLVITLKSFGRSDHLANPQFLEDVVNKPSNRMKLRWGEYLLDNNESELADVEVLNCSLQKKARALSLASCTESGNTTDIRKKKVFLASELAEENKEKNRRQAVLKWISIWQKGLNIKIESELPGLVDEKLSLQKYIDESV